MVAVLITGMSGVGKSSVIQELARRGHHAVDTDTDEYSEWITAEDGPDWVWREDRLGALLDEAAGAPLFVAGCKSNQGKFSARFGAVVLLSAPAAVLLRRVQERTTNPYGQTPQDRARMLEHIGWVEPLLRAAATLELDTSRLGVPAVADRLEALLERR